MTLLLKSKAMQVSAIAVTAMLVSSPAYARKSITPYIEVDQTVSAQLKGGDEVLTYTSVAAGIDASVQNSRSEFQISYRYEHNFAWNDPIQDGDVHSGLARGSVQVVPGVVTMEGGAIATRARNDIRGAAPGILDANSGNTTQVYSAYVGPTVSHNVGPVQLNSAYRLGYTKVESDERVALAPGEPLLDNYDDSVSHLASVTASMSPGELPFGWTVGAAYEREDTGQLDQRFESLSARGDLMVPITPTLAAVGGVGYEDVEISQRNAVLGAGGTPVLGGDGRFVTDKTSARQLAYETDGIYWDAGLSWRPSSRTDLEFRVGRRYGTMSYTGALSYQMDEATAFSIVGYDQVQTFGQQLSDNLSRLPTSFRPTNSSLGQNYGGCTYGNGGSAGGCMNGALGSINTAAYRSRGVSASMSSSRGPWSSGVGIGYEQRKYLAPSGVGYTVNGQRDQTVYAQANVGRKLTEASSIDGSIFGSLYDPGIPGSPDVLSTGALGGYSHSFGRLSARASAGIYHFDPGDAPSEVSATAQVGLRYSF
jgi:hypothetical protein